MITGAIKLLNDDKLLLKLNENENEIINIINIDTDENKKLLIENSEVADHGDTLSDIRIYDMTKRNAFKITKDKFNIFLSEEIRNNIEEKLKLTLFSKFNPKTYNIKLEINQMNIYEKDGFFKEHIDKINENQVGTLILLLPTTFDGGELECEYHDEKYIWDNKSKNIENIKWIAFKNNTKHNINVIKSGIRITITYNILVTNPRPYGPKYIVIHPNYNHCKEEEEDYLLN